MTDIIPALSSIAPRYDVLFCDLWGCLHDGTKALPDAVAALQNFRGTGGTVVLVTNSPRPRGSVGKQLEGLGAPKDCYDAIVSSGDAAQAAMAAGLYGRKIYHLGPDRDLTFFKNPDGTPIDVERVALDDAEGVVCTGLFDDRTETPEDYRLTLMTAKNRGLKMLCANPDIIVDVGDHRIYCAGALAEFYKELGGEAHYYGKPHAPIYQLARLEAEKARGQSIRDDHILCVGDGIHTDIQGGIGEGLDTLFVTGGLAAQETGTKDGNPDSDKLATFLAAHHLSPTAALGFLR